MRKVIFGICMIASACASPEADDELRVVKLDDATEMEVNLSALIDNVRIIPLETSEEHLIANPHVYFTDDFLLVGSQTQSEPGRLFRFDYSGKFLNEIGKGTAGKGPGEHTGHPNDIRYYEKDQTIQVNWGGGGRDPQLFTMTGDFVRDVLTTGESFGLSYVERWNDSIWFGSGQWLIGRPFSKADSSLIHFFTSDGRAVSEVPRKGIPEKGPQIISPPIPVRYKKNGSWKFFIDGMDTLFQIEDRHLIPEVVFENENRMPYNTINSEEEFGRKVMIFSIAEGTNYWLLQRMEIANDPLRFLKEVPLILVGKSSFEATNLRLKDDLFGMFPGTIYSEKWNLGNPFQDSRMQLVVNADELLTFFGDQGGQIAPSIQQELDKLSDLKEEDNPVIFLFTLKDEITL